MAVPMIVTRRTPAWTFRRAIIPPHTPISICDGNTRTRPRILWQAAVLAAVRQHGFNFPRAPPTPLRACDCCGERAPAAGTCCVVRTTLRTFERLSASRRPLLCTEGKYHVCVYACQPIPPTTTPCIAGQASVTDRAAGNHRLPFSLPSRALGNAFERQLFVDYLAAKSVTHPQMLIEALDKLTNGG